MENHRPPIVYLWCAPEDELHRKKLETMLAPRARAKELEIQHEGGNAPGADKLRPTDFIHRAQLVVLLLTAAFVRDYGDVELPIAQDRRRNEGLHVLPVRVKAYDVDASELRWIKAIEPCPKSQNVVDYEDHDDAWLEIARAIGELCSRHRLYARRPTVSPAPYEMQLNSGSDEKCTPAPMLLEREDGGQVMTKNTAEFHELLGGQLLDGRFKLLRRVRHTRVARWQGWDVLMKQPVMVHVLDESLSADEGVRRQIFDRVRRWSLLPKQHFARAIVQGATSDDGRSYFVTELLEGTLYEQLVQDGFELPSIFPLVLRICRILSEAHERGFDHGDLHPDEILVGADGRLKLSGFHPLAGVTFEEDASSGPRVRSPFMAPELLGSNDVRDLARRADVYALAMIVAFALRGGEGSLGSPESPKRLIESLDINGYVKGVLRKATDARPEGRYPDARAFCDALAAAYRASRSTALVEMAHIPGGTFEMGTNDPAARPHWRPARTVTVSAFTIGKYPVTQSQYLEVMAHNPSQFPQEANTPVNRVSFHDAIEFCNRLSFLEGLTPAYSYDGSGSLHCDWTSDGYRLPTEAEWEYAARGPQSLEYPWGDTFAPERVCWNGVGNAIGAHNRKGPCSVLTCNTASPFGVQQLIGNVWEWCWDWYAPYETLPPGPLVDPVGAEQPSRAPVNFDLAGSALRMMRGGAWTDTDQLWLQNVSRVFDDESVRDANVGFRVVRRPRQG